MSDLSGPIVALNDVRLSLTSSGGPVEILRGVDFCVQSGRSTAIIGPSGSGKTSLLMVIAGLERASSGTIRVAGHDIGAMSEDELARLRGTDIGIVFQSFHLVPTMTALENIALPLELQGRDNAHNDARELLSNVGLSDRAGHFPAELSGGEQQRVAIARALSTRPKLILADEPTGNLDAKTGAYVVDQLFELQKAYATTLVLITHDESLARRCEAISHMHDGRVIEGANPAPVSQEANVK